MSARSHHRIRQSGLGLDDVGMDLQSNEFVINNRFGQEVSSKATVSWIHWKLTYPILVCALIGAILFTFLFLLWLRKQMSSEKKSGDCDRRGLVEEGPRESSSSSSAIDKPGKSTQHSSIEAQWIHQTVVKMPVSVKPIKSVPKIKESSSSSSASTVTTTDTSKSVVNNPSASVATPERRLDSGKIKPRGLLERRGSSASLTIELAPSQDYPTSHIVTPTHESTSEEYLLSTSNKLSREQLKKSIKNPVLLHQEFWEVPLNVPDKIDVFGVAMKNRYSGVLPNPQSRVILMGTDDPIASYINANYIRGYDGEFNRYIATQGPLTNTVDDFWKMVWTENVPAVVMMTRLSEASKTKCDIYFPIKLNSRIQSGSFTVTVTSIVNRDGYTVRDLELNFDGNRKIITHYWYDSWPDHDVPQSPDALVSLAAEVNNLSGPIVVHCSAGIGRTGCFIALASGMTQLSRDGIVDVLGILCQMRYDRGGMVQTAEQYEFIHKALCLFEKTMDSKKSMPGAGD